MIAVRAPLSNSNPGQASIAKEWHWRPIGRVQYCYCEDTDGRCAVLQTSIVLVVAPARWMEHPTLINWCPTFLRCLSGGGLYGRYWTISFTFPRSGILSASLYLTRGVFGWLEMCSVEMNSSYSYIPGPIRQFSQIEHVCASVPR